MIPLIIDSGAFSAANRGEPISLENWINFCLKIKKKNPDIQFVNLDVLSETEDTGDISYQNWRKMRTAGVDAIPVYHVSTGEEYLRLYLQETDYVAVGAIASMEQDKRMMSLDRVWEKYFIDKDRIPKIKVHGMGITSFPLMKRYPWYSVDSTAWLQASIYGKIFVPKLKDGDWDYGRPPYQMSLSLKSPKIQVKGLHIETLPPGQRKVLDRYISEMGFSLGKTEFDKEGNEVVIEMGVQNNYENRCWINAKFFAKFTQALPWPRAFGAKRPLGLFA